MRKEIQALPNPPQRRGNNTLAKAMTIFPALLINLSVAAQGEQAAPGLMRSNLKIYVVVAVLVIIFTGISLFLFSLERRLKKLEESNK